MFDSASARSARTMLALTAATTVGLSGLAGAAQADDETSRHRAVDVTVCKKVVDPDHHAQDDARGAHHRPVDFDFTVRVNDHHAGEFSLTGRGRKRCHTFEVDRKDRVKLREHRTPGYELKRFHVTGAHDVSTKASSVTFRAGRGDIEVTVVNHKRDRH